MTIAVYAGTFDPPTIGHVSVIERAAEAFDRVHVVVAVNPDKKFLFGAEARVELLEQVCAEYPNVEVCFHEGFMFEYCHMLDTDDAHPPVLVRGLRGEADLKYELEIAAYNAARGVDSVFLPAAPGLADVSSSKLKEMILANDQRARLYAASPTIYEAARDLLFHQGLIEQ